MLLFIVSNGAGHPAEPMTPRRLAVGDERILGRVGTGRLSGSARERGPAVHRLFEGFWAADRAACRDPDSDQRMAIEAHTIDWYETRCGILAVAPAGRRAWHLDLMCRGEGQRMEARAVVSLPTPGTLTIDDGPIGPSRHQSYIRCKPR